MAEDTRQSKPTGAPTASPLDPDPNARPYKGKVYEGFLTDPAPAPPESANVLPGANANTAGGRPHEVSVLEAAKTIHADDFRTFHQKPCVRESLLTGIGGGFAAGGLTAIFGKPISRASNWAVGVFCLGAFGMYQFCLVRRQMEKDGLKRAVEVMDRKKMEREARMKEAREARRKAKEEQDRVEEAQRRAEEERRKSTGSGWKFW